MKPKSQEQFAEWQRMRMKSKTIKERIAWARNKIEEINRKHESRLKVRRNVEAYRAQKAEAEELNKILTNATKDILNKHIDAIKANDESP